jgi:hypothetical protein
MPYLALTLLFPIWPWLLLATVQIPHQTRLPALSNF